MRDLGRWNMLLSTSESEYHELRLMTGAAEALFVKSVLEWIHKHVNLWIYNDNTEARALAAVKE